MNMKIGMKRRRVKNFNSKQIINQTFANKGWK